jgi:hypothetical protein
MRFFRPRVGRTRKDRHAQAAPVGAVDIHLVGYLSERGLNWTPDLGPLSKV